jgi:uncharacterized protein with PIN domain
VSEPRGPAFLADRCLGDFVVVDALRARGADVRAHADEFAPNAKDVEWLRVAGDRGWVVLTKDPAILRRRA